jgi:hypothetical protein
MIGRKILLDILRLVEVAGGKLVDHTLQVALLED